MVGSGSGFFEVMMFLDEARLRFNFQFKRRQETERGETSNLELTILCSLTWSSYLCRQGSEPIIPIL